MPEIPPTPAKTSFKQLQNESAGRNSIKVKLLKYGTESIAIEIETIYNKIARTRKYSNDIN